MLELPSKKTEFARSLLPRSLPLKAMTHNVAMASTLVAGFAKSDIQLIGRGMEDAVVEPARRKMIPGYNSVRENAMASGAAGVGISGAGPTMLAFVDTRKASATAVLNAMKAGFASSGVRADGFVTRIGRGACIMHA
jgi:homoserine kinase